MIRLVGLVSAALLSALWAGVVGACQICIPLPERTLADRLLASDAVVLAREDAARPFHYQAIETLAGDPGDDPIGLFLHSQARRALAVDPGRAMVLAHGRGGDGWTALGLTTGEFEHVVREILARADRWRPREADNRERLEWFVPLLGHLDVRLHELAYLEIGRAPYAEIRRLAPRLDPGTLRRMLDDPRYLEWRRLAILMLGESPREEDRQRVRDALARQARAGGTPDLAAWATALIAVDGLAGIDRIAALYADDPGRSRGELTAVIQALSVQAGADPTLRRRVAELYGVLLERRPEIAPNLVHDLIAWHRWDFTGHIERARTVLADDPLARYALGLYLRLAAANEILVNTSNDGDTSNRTDSHQPTQE